VLENVGPYFPVCFSVYLRVFFNGYFIPVKICDLLKALFITGFITGILMYYWYNW
jgi:hypothetical protein